MLRDARFVIGVATTPHDNTRLFFLGATVLIVAAATWLAIEIRRAWVSTPSPRADRGRDGRTPAAETHPLVPQLVEEIIRLNATITRMREASNPPIPAHTEAAHTEAELANWALAGLEARVADRQRETHAPHDHGVAAQRGQPCS